MRFSKYPSSLKNVACVSQGRFSDSVKFQPTSIKDRRLFGTVLSEPTKLLPFKKSMKWMVWKHDTVRFAYGSRYARTSSHRTLSQKEVFAMGAFKSPLGRTVFSLSSIRSAGKQCQKSPKSIHNSGGESQHTFIVLEKGEQCQTVLLMGKAA